MLDGTARVPTVLRKLAMECEPMDRSPLDLTRA
jgi:hypothetical protein